MTKKGRLETAWACGQRKERFLARRLQIGKAQRIESGGFKDETGKKIHPYGRRRMKKTARDVSK